MKKNHKRISAAVLSLALGFTVAGAPLFAPVAGAQVAISAGDASTVDLDADVSLTINKFEGEPGDTSTGLASTFTVKKITLANQLNTLAGWQEVATKQAALPNTLPTVSATDVWTLTTTGSGTVTISTAATGATYETVDTDFTVGAYLVTETAPSGYTVSAPFIVTVPFTDNSGVWDYSQVVNPKNQTVSVEKNVTDAGVRLGQDLSYTISASLPAEDLTSLVIEDPLPAELSAATNIVVSRTSTNGNANDATLVEDLGSGGDYTITHTGNDLKVTLTGQGLGDLNSLRNIDSGLTLNVTFDATVIALPTNDGVISNDAIVTYPNSVIDTASSSTDPYPGTETRLGSLTVNKQDKAGNAITTDSATFELWRCSLVGGKWTVSGTALPVITESSVTTKTALDSYITANGALPTSFTTDTTGSETIYGVQAFDFVNGVETTNSNFCLVETVAPAGYNLNPEPIPVDTYVDATHATPNFYNMNADVENLANDDIVNLPETGGNGTMALIAAGVVVAAAGGAVAVRGNRARKTN